MTTHGRASVGAITQLTGDVTAGPGGGSQVATLNDMGVVAGTYGASNAVPNFIAHSDGRISAIDNLEITLTSANVTENESITQAVPVSGTAYQPSPTYPAEVTFQLNATVAGSFTLTFGPTTGAEYTVANAVAMLVGSDLVFTKHIPPRWHYILTATGVTIGTCTTELL